MTEDLTIYRRDGLIEAEVDGELVALHVDNGACYGFNATATRIWALLKEPKKLSELRDLLMDEYEIDAATCEREVDELIKHLEADGLVEIRGA